MNIINNIIIKLKYFRLNQLSYLWLGFVFFISFFSLLSRPQSDDFTYIERIKGHHLQKLDSSSYIDWSKGKIYLKVREFFSKNINDSNYSLANINEMRLKARRQALEKAEEKLSILINNIEILNSKKSIAKLDKPFHIESRYTANDYIDLVLSLSLWGENSLYTLISKDENTSYKIPELKSKLTAPKISSLILITKGLNDFKPSLSPRIYSKDGLVIYSPEIANRYCAKHAGLSVYYELVDTATKDDRAGKSPYISYPIALSGKHKHDLILHDKDIIKILTSPTGRKALLECRVIIVIDKTS